jgi:virginiamycin B lyase
VRKLLLLVVLAVSMLTIGARLSGATEAFGLMGVVSSDAEGPMEGVLVSAKRAPGTITVTVVTDNRGRYTLPAGRLEPGQYHISIRAIGYDAADPGLVATVEKGTTEVDIKLVKTKDLALQLSDAEWLMSAPGTYEQKQHLFITCSHCHTLTPIFQST